MVNSFKYSSAQHKWTGWRLTCFTALSLGIFLLSFSLNTPLLVGVSIVLGLCSIAIAIIDLSELIIPDILSLPLIPLGFLFTAYLQWHDAIHISTLDHLIAAAAGFLMLLALRILYLKFRGIEALGLGDVKFAAVIGAWVGMTGLIWTLLLASVTALLFTGVQAMRYQEALALDRVVPFGAFLAPALWIIWFLQTKYDGLIVGLRLF